MNICDICGKDYPVLVHVVIYDKNFQKGTKVKEARVCKLDLAKL